MNKISKKASQGFTLIEVLIAVAVMGILVYFAVNFISGDTSKANFTVSINDFKQKVEQFINETANGYYPNKGDFTCSGFTDGVTPPSFSSPSTTGQGQNYNCIFLGKVILFNLSSGQYSVYIVVGNQFDFQQSPTYVYNNGATNGTSPDIPLDSTSGNPYSAITQTLPNGLMIKSVSASASSAAPSISTTAVGFLVGDSTGNIAGYGASGLNSGAEPLSLYYDSVTGLGSTNYTQLNTDVRTTKGVGGATNNGLLNATEIDICVAGGSNQSGKLKIGDAATVSSSSASNLGVNLTVYNDGTCT